MLGYFSYSPSFHTRDVIHKCALYTIITDSFLLRTYGVYAHAVGARPHVATSTLVRTSRSALQTWRWFPVSVLMGALEMFMSNFDLSSPPLPPPTPYSSVNNESSGNFHEGSVTQAALVQYRRVGAAVCSDTATFDHETFRMR